MLEEVLAQWSSLKPDWDGEDAPAIDPACLDKLRWVLDLFEKRGFVEPIPFIAGDGEIGVRYTNSSCNGYADVCIRKNHDMLSFAYMGIHALFSMTRTIESVEEIHLRELLNAIDMILKGN